MTPFATTQRAARFAEQLNIALDEHREQPAVFDTKLILTVLYRAGLTLDADLGPASPVKAALERIGA